MKIKKVFLLSIGDEVLDGRTQNSNATFFSEQLRMNGIGVSEIRTISDDPEQIVRTLREANGHSLVVATGGLGPTNDDRTLQSASQFIEKPLHITPQSLRHVRDRYKKRNLPLTESRRKLALIPKGATLIPNPTGTAPGVLCRTDGTTYIFLPGPPPENRPMFLKEVLPLAKKLCQDRVLVKRFFWRTFGQGESTVYQRIAPIIERLEKHYQGAVVFGVHITFPYIDLTFEIWRERGLSPVPPKAYQTAANEITRLINDICFTRERKILSDVVFELCKRKGLTLAVAESCTGGLLGKQLTDFSGSSAVFLGGAISYANHAKTVLLGVPKSTLVKFGAVSEATVRAMAQSIRKQLRSDYAVALSGVSGPSGGTKEKPVGTICIAVAGRKRTIFKHQIILQGQGSRDQNRIIAVNLALNALRSEILGLQEG